MLTDDQMSVLRVLSSDGKAGPLSDYECEAIRAALDTIREQGQELLLLRAEVAAFRAYSLPALARCAEELVLLRRVAPAVTQMATLIAESRGVSGLHLNGDEAPWGELLRGGRYEEWLSTQADAEVAAAEWRERFGGQAT